MPPGPFSATRSSDSWPRRDLGVKLDGERDVLGLWVGPTGGEGAKQWATMLTELRNRGLADALIVCCDGLKSLPESIRATWPQAVPKLCRASGA
jgi:putative transposase